MKLHPRNPRASNNLLIPWLALAAALLILGGFIVYSQYQRHERIEQRERERLDSQTGVITKRTIRPDNRADLYSDWRRETYGMGAVYGILVLTTTIGLLFYQKRQRRFDALSADYEAAQRVNSERLRMVTESTGLGVWDYDLENGRLTWDDAMFTIFGREPAGFSSVYNDWRDSVLPDDLAEVEAALQAAILAKQPFSADFRITRDDGEVRDIRCVAMVHCNESSRAVRVIGINEDITKQKQAQLQLEELNKVLKQRTDEAEQAICSKNRFLDMVAHEFRTPLSLLTSSTDILDRYGELLSEEQRTKQNGHIRSAASQISGMIDSVIVFNRQGADRTDILPERLNVGQICRAIAGEVSTVWGMGQVFQVTVPADCETALLNGILFRRVLENLLTNAFRYTPGEGVVSLHVTCDGDSLTVLVTDSGIGIPEEDRQRIFEAFYRSSNAGTRHGLGLGLSIVLEALSKMNGAISVDSTLGKGTKMQVVIPLTEESDEEDCFSCIQS